MIASLSASDIEEEEPPAPAVAPGAELAKTGPLVEVTVLVIEEVIRALGVGLAR